MLSYTNEVKEEILHKEITNKKEKLYELYALLKSKNSIFENRIEFRVENIVIAKRVYSIIKETTQLAINIKVSISKRFGEHKVYSVTIPSQKGLKRIIEFLNKIENEKIYKNERKLSGYTRGMFLANGYMKKPEKEYAVDFFIENKEEAERLYNFLKTLGKKVFLTEKMNKHIVYIRNSEDIMDLLVMMGAMKTFFEYEEVTMVKDIKNKTIRSMNWEVANETKVMNTAQNHIKIIEYIEGKEGLEFLSDALKEIAKVRLDNPEASLNEIAEIIGITKSGVRNRFRRIEELYNELKEKEIK